MNGLQKSRVIDAMLITSALEYQPGFPKEDLTAKNTEILSLMLQNQVMLIEGHQAFRTAIDRLHTNQSAIEAVTVFIYATPRAAEVAAELAQMYTGVRMARLAVIGAGMARKFELDNTDIDSMDSETPYFT